MLALAARLLPAPLHAQPSDARELQAERSRLIAEIRKLRGSGRFDDAAGALDKLLAVERKIFGEIHSEIASSLDWLAQTHLERGDYPAARRAASSALEVCQKLHDVARLPRVRGLELLDPPPQLPESNRP